MLELQNIVSSTKPTGTLDAWRKVINMMVRRKMWDQLAVVLAGAAAPLMKFTGLLGMTVHVAVRPEKMTVQFTPPRDDERESPDQIGFNVVQGVIEDLAYLGSLTTYHVRLDGGTVVKVTHTNSARHTQAPLTWGSPVYVWWCGSDVVVLTQ
jgi:ABC-type Fe3+/spermidine/putrescine transport system ATPase subunit